MKPQPLTAEHHITDCIACHQPIIGIVTVLPVIGAVVINPDRTATVPVENRITGMRLAHECTDVPQAGIDAAPNDA